MNYGFVMEYNKYEYYGYRLPEIPEEKNALIKEHLTELPYKAHFIKIYYQKINMSNFITKSSSN